MHTFVFFCKQTTAYEMRISDWSSDVCSSDLGTMFSFPSIKPVYAHCDLPCGVYDPAQARIEAQSVREIQKKMANFEGDDRVRALFIKEERAELVKLGRASCRERVCQYG